MSQFAPPVDAVGLDPRTRVRLPVPRPVDRFRYVAGLCAGQRVLDLGAYDETEVDQPHSAAWRWLHGEIASVADEVLGVDASPKLAEVGEVRTRVGTRIVHGDVAHLGAVAAGFQPDVVVAGELIEHTPDTLGWLTRLGRHLPGVRFVATTPNATWFLNMLLALGGRESSHPDHIQIYSYRTLVTTAERIPLRDIVVTPYYFSRAVAQHRARRLGPGVAALDVLLLRPVQALFPLLARGLILTGTFAPTGGGAVAGVPAPAQRPADWSPAGDEFAG
jgi:hypothetical protein